MSKLTITISDGIVLSNFPAGVLRRVREKLEVPNDVYHMLMRKKGRRPYGIDPFHKFYWKHKDGLKIPRGMEDTLLNYMDLIGLEYNLERRTINKTVDLRLKPIDMREYQDPLVEAAVKRGSGMFVAGTGVGKTVMAIELIRRLGKTATIIVPKLTLAAQFQQEMRDHFGYECGMINGKEKTIKEITVSTIQSLNTNQELLNELVENTSVLIYDECQGVTSKSATRVFNSFKAEHFFGLTASPDRDDSTAPGVYFMFGEEPIVEYHATQLSPTVEVFQTRHYIAPSYDYHEMINDMVEHEMRNKLIAGLIGGSAFEGRKVLVLTKRIAHYEKFKESFPPSDAFRYISSDDKGRDKMLMRMKKGLEDFSVIFGTTSLLSVGVDIPELDTLILACDMKGKVLTTQSVGRVLRSFGGKKEPKIIDFHDGYEWDYGMKQRGVDLQITNSTLHRQFKSRLDLYKDKNWTVEYKGGILPYKWLHVQD